MAPTDGRVTKPEQRWKCHRGTPVNMMHSCLDNLDLVNEVEMCLWCRLERANCLPCSYVLWQLVPGLRTRHRKCTGAKVHDRAGGYKVTTRVA